MKHNLQITLVLIVMFFITQMIGLAVINAYAPRTEQHVVNGTVQNITVTPELPYGLQPPQVQPQVSLISIAISLAIAILLVLFLTRVNAVWVMRIWFFVVVIMALGISFNAILKNITIYSALIAFIIAVPIAYFKIFKRNLIVHNLSELLIYPGVAAILVPILNIWAGVILLILISIYDVYAVWHAGFMQEMAKFQINKLKFFTGFFVPYMGKKQREQIKKTPKSKLKSKKVKVSLAILGGGDVVFPMIIAGIVLSSLGFIPALIVSIFSTLALLGLFILAEKGKFYPAMPFISAGCFIGLAIVYFILPLI